MRTVDAVMSRLLVVGAVSVCLALINAASGQEPNIKFEANTIAFPIPPLARAVLTGNPEVIRQALEKGADVNEPVLAKEGARAGFTPLILAAAFTGPSIAKILIERGADITILDNFHRSALWYAAFRQDVELTKMLINAPGAKEIINAADSDLMRTPLQLAIRSNDPGVASVLVAMGASRDQKDIAGETPVDFCRHHATGACKVF